MTASTTLVPSVGGPFTRTEAVELGRIEYQRFIEALTALHPDDWGRPTDCEGWTVRDLAGHLAGSMETARGLRHLLGEQRAIKKRRKETGEAEIDAMAAVQVAKVADLAPAELIERMRALVQPAIAGRLRIPEIIGRHLRFPVEIGSLNERWDVLYLHGTILTRDTWLHRVSDLARAVQRSPTLDEAHDGRIVADVAGEWARRHGQPVDLQLTGPAGGQFTTGANGPTIELDAIEFCRILSGRAQATHELLATEVPF
ncbi:MAG: maleylpyruvate isomerase family mycothiol-dependent enzyme [Microthrixaceae bacterium]